MTRSKQSNSYRGFTLAEISIALAIVSMVSLIAPVVIKVLNNIKYNQALSNVHVEAKKVFWMMNHEIRNAVAMEINPANPHHLKLVLPDYEYYLRPEYRDGGPGRDIADMYYAANATLGINADIPTSDPNEGNFVYIDYRLKLNPKTKKLALFKEIQFPRTHTMPNRNMDGDGFQIDHTGLPKKWIYLEGNAVYGRDEDNNILPTFKPNLIGKDNQTDSLTVQIHLYLQPTEFQNQKLGAKLFSAMATMRGIQLNLL